MAARSNRRLARKNLALDKTAKAGGSTSSGHVAAFAGLKKPRGSGSSSFNKKHPRRKDGKFRNK